MGEKGCFGVFALESGEKGVFFVRSCRFESIQS